MIHSSSESHFGLLFTLEGIHGLKSTCKLNYITINAFLPVTKNSNNISNNRNNNIRNTNNDNSNISNNDNNKYFSKLDESLYEEWGVKLLWNSKPFSLMKLPFNPQKMDPFLSEEAIKYHYSKHHATYVKNLNNLTEQHNELRNLTLEEVIEKYTGPIYNNAAQTFNHNLFWLGLKEEGGGKPYGEIKNKIEDSFTSFENFKEVFLKEASGHFGSGWVWLIIKDKKLKIYQGHDADNPIKNNIGRPILTLDVWEHAYYVDYKNSRVDYIKEWFNKINWDFANYNLSIIN
ncbi:superoxide dismutase [Fe], putative [Plasmodium malariae]|uniref:Superoxide dismutase [Fe] n=1 Tax=Plasmodium malariae TaxID=5858 RepID=A0A1D3SMR6_PLAMA|nr:superoxide dismutase [Fe], putative [Plasmodium malariae]SCO93150.1 superoxide dismutase [Fe], putative [Plasmodium malariae]